ncbi:MAG: hypothetical protein RMK43_00760 [Cyclobacteriaceae bacterium]|nr:hypothetical protein [Cyclobacteriaceae bacterium]
MIRIISTWIAILSSVVCAFAQQDFLVTLKGDTIFGIVNCTRFGQSQRIECIIGKKKQYFTPVQVRTFRSGNEYYFPVRTADGYQIMKLLKPGYLSLYAFQMENQITWDGLYLVKKDGSGLEYSGLLFKKRMARFTEDCPEVSRQLEERELRRNDLYEIIDLYNQCIEARTQTQTTTAKRILRWEELEQMVQELPAFEGKQDALDMIREIRKKIDNQETIPRFLRENLRSILKPFSRPSELLDQLLNEIQSQ